MPEKLNKVTLHRLYITERKTIREIAKIFGCSRQTILNRCIEYGIERRRVKESKKILRSITITSEQLARLKRLSEKSHVPYAEYIRKGIDLALNRYEKQGGGKDST